MYLLFNCIVNIYRYKARYILSGLLVIIMSFICYTSQLMILTYTQALEKAKAGEFIKFPPDDIQVLMYTLLANRISVLDAVIKINIAIGLLVIAYTTMMCINERKFDIGVLRSMGMSKTKIFLSFAYELGIFIFSSIIIGVVPAILFGLKLMFALDSDFFHISNIIVMDSVTTLSFALHVIITVSIIVCIPILGVSIYILSYSPRDLLCEKRQ